MVPRAEEPGTAASAVVDPTSIGTVAKAELLEGQWRLVKLLGQGAVGQVWQAHDVTLDRAVAVKLMHAAVAEHPQEVARFEREAQVLAALEHPNLLPVLGMGRMGERPFLVTRLLEGKTLAEVLHQRGGKLPPAETARILVPICDALHCLHEAKVVHRDVKPSNVFVSNDERVTLMDLGSAYAQGTEGYLSPEQKAGRGDLNGKSDVYALGCLLREMLGDWAPMTLAALAGLATSSDPNERPTPLELKAKLAPYLANEEVTAPIARPLEAPTQHAVFTPTTGSPSYPDIPAVQAEPSTAQVQRVLAAPAHDEKVMAPANRTRMVARRFAPQVSPRVGWGLATGAALIVVAFVFAMAQPRERIPPTVRVDNPKVEVVIEKPELKLAAVPDLTKAALPVPNLLKKKEAVNTNHGYVVPPAKKTPARSPLPPGLVRLITTSKTGIVTCVMWMKRSPRQQNWELLGRTPVQFIAAGEEMEIRLRERPDDPFLQFSYRASSKPPWFKSLGKIRVEVGPPSSEDEPVSRAEPEPEEETTPQPDELSPAENSLMPR